MMEQRPKNWPLVGVLVFASAAAGFGVARWLPNKPAVPAVATPAQSSEHKSGSAVEVNIPDEYLKVANIAIEPVTSGGLEAEVLAPATVTAQPNNEAAIVTRAAGSIVRIHRQLGDSVRAGDILAQVESLEAAAMAADRHATQAKAEQARKAYAREARLFEQGVTPRQELEAAQATLAVAEADAGRAASVAQTARLSKDGKSVAVVSPIAGKVTLQAATLGSYVQPQTELFRVAGEGAAQVEASIAAADIGRIAAGDKAIIVVAGGTPVAAKVRSVTPTVNGNTRTATAILTPETGGGHLVVGEGVQARLHVKERSNALAVPEDAVQNIDGRDVLFVRTKDGFRAQPVLVGMRSRGMAVIVSGVKAGEQVATQNAFLVKADMIKSEKEE